MALNLPFSDQQADVENREWCWWSPRWSSKHPSGYFCETLDSKEIKQSILKEINPEFSLEGLMLKWKLQYFGHLMQRADSLEKTLTLRKIEGRKRRGR